MKKILIIDDHAVVREGIRSALENTERFHVFQAASKSEAIAQITKIAPDGIIVDINLPDGNGLEIVSWVRSISSTIAIVVLTLNEHDISMKNYENTKNTTIYLNDYKYGLTISLAKIKT